MHLSFDPDKFTINKFLVVFPGGGNKCKPFDKSYLPIVNFEVMLADRMLRYITLLDSSDHAI
jgi:hypothetical protein